MLAKRKITFLVAALLVVLFAVGACGASPASRGGASPAPSASASKPAPSAPASKPAPADGPIWQLKWQADFSQPAPLGSFSGCDNYDRTPEAYCSGLPANLQWQWWAYPYPWPDSATEVHLPVGGYYDPGQTVSISGGQMHIRMFRQTSSVHSAAVVPKASIGMLYGKFVETFKVDPDGSPGYGSAHLLWPTSAPLDYEVDYPEGSWDAGYCIHVHSAFEKGLRSFCPSGVTWTQWNTTEIDWTPTSLTFFLNGRQIFQVTGKNWVPDEPMSWIIQNQAAINGEQALPNSSAQLNISHVAVYSYEGEG